MWHGKPAFLSGSFFFSIKDLGQDRDVKLREYVRRVDADKVLKQLKVLESRIKKESIDRR